MSGGSLSEVGSGDFVLDCSVTMCWCFAAEGDADTRALLEALTRHSAHVPTFWALEVANVLAVAERRGRLRPATSARFLALLEALPVEIDPQTPLRAGGRTLDLARAHGLSAHDAAYLELALRRGLPLATRDEALAAAAEALGLTAW